MFRKLIAISLLLVIVLFSCKKNKDHSDDFPSPTNPLFTTWEFIWFEDNVQYMIKSDQLEGDRYGFRIEPDGTFIERKNSDECGPNSCYEYENYQGTWTQTGDNLYHISVPFYAGHMEYNILVLSIVHDTLKYTIPYPAE